MVLEFSLLLAAASLCAFVGVGHTSEVNVGGELGTWTIGLEYTPVQLTLGDTLVFAYTRGQHDVVQIAAPDCSLPSAERIAGLTASPFRLTFNATGTYHYSCSVAGHCDAGMLLTVKVVESPTEPHGDSQAASQQRQIKEGGTCSQAERVGGQANTYMVSCRSGGIPMVPGEVVNEFHALPNPYPDAVVAVIKQTSQIVDATGRPVPISEIYLHHHFGNGRFVQGEGAEVRGTMHRQSLPEPYYYITNGTDFSDPQTRRTNVHLIDTRGVLAFDIGPCVECWCRNETEARAQDYMGGTACCTPLNCRSQFANASSMQTTYYLQYNVTYRFPEQMETLAQAHMQLLEVTGGEVEYDVHRREPGSEDLKNLTTSVDAQCPQQQPFGVLRCTGHLHIGGTCVDLYDAVTDHLICSSCAKYGSSPSADMPGQEHGYLVEMLDDTLNPPYQLSPRQAVRLVSRYDASVDHYGVMGFLVVTLVDWDPTCPAIPPGSPTKHSVFTVFMPATGSVADTYLQQILGTSLSNEDASNTAWRWNVVIVSVASSLAFVAISAAILVMLLKRPDVRAFLSRYKPLRDSGEVEQISLNT